MSANPKPENDSTVYKVLIRVEDDTDQVDFTIWPANQTNPTGWKDIKKIGTKQECIDYAVKVRSKRSFL